MGYNEDKLPFAFLDCHRTLVGYHIEMAHSLARDLSVTLEFLRFDRSTLIQQLDADHFDVIHRSETLREFRYQKTDNWDQLSFAPVNTK